MSSPLYIFLDFDSISEYKWAKLKCYLQKKRPKIIANHYDYHTIVILVVLNKDIDQLLFQLWKPLKQRAHDESCVNVRRP